MACILKYVPYVFFDILMALFFIRNTGKFHLFFMPRMPSFLVHSHYNNVHHEHDFIMVYSIF